MTSAQMREKVVEARRIQEERYRGMPHRENGWLEESEIIRYCLPDQGGQELLRQAYEKMGLTMRAYLENLQDRQNHSGSGGKRGHRNA